ncbi:hypothetical protein GQ607_003000 [Colletotrichum asianum]|uniref:Uncharacterized protein n=1 Tax=Colletotrichum asianum TaxID=702518 RepID=A0A8H3ZVW9_9PEZI|nr:hypothetical protein GQ607_003000 [Colletotrichum asianum]
MPKVFCLTSNAELPNRERQFHRM